MEDLKFVISNTELNTKDMAVVTRGMLAHHASQGHPRKTDIFTILLKDKKNKILGCVIISFLWNGVEIKTLWVDESVRKQGWGSKLMKAAEEEAIKRGCTIAYTNTFSWQAPGFYEKLGYILYGKLNDFPKGNSLSYFRKNL